MSHRLGKRRRREQAERERRYSFEDIEWGGATYGRWHGPGRGFEWFSDMPWPRHDRYDARTWKSRPVPEGEHPYRVNPVDGVVDLHPSQWSVR